MTETCNGYFDSYYGDKPKKKGVSDDVYHPVYPEATKASQAESSPATKAGQDNAQSK